MRCIRLQGDKQRAGSFSCLTLSCNQTTNALANALSRPFYGIHKEEQIFMQEPKLHVKYSKITVKDEREETNQMQVLGCAQWNLTVDSVKEEKNIRSNHLMFHL